MATRKQHAYPLPPPTKLPVEIADEVQDVLRKQDTLALTARRFLLSPDWTDIHDRFGPSSLRSLHKVLNIKDKVASLIRKERLLHYPARTSIAGTLARYMLSIC